MRSGQAPVTCVGHGVDIVELARVERLLREPEGEWRIGAFTPAERALASPPPGEISFFAGRFAAKEAVAKALGSGVSGDVAWSDIEILREPDGRPTVRLSGGARSLAETLGVRRWLVSISHSGAYAVASAIAVAD